jgi:hypothetical protein
MSRNNPWARHYQSVWLERSRDERLPLWFRVSALAFGRHRVNGHALFGRGEIAQALASRQKRTSGTRTLDKGSVQRAIRQAIAYGMLSDRSGTRCLVVPPHAISGGLYGHQFTPCPEHPEIPANTVGTDRLQSRRQTPTNRDLTSRNDELLYDSLVQDPVENHPRSKSMSGTVSRPTALTPAAHSEGKKRIRLDSTKKRIKPRVEKKRIKPSS